MPPTWTDRLKWWWAWGLKRVRPAAARPARLAAERLEERVTPAFLGGVSVATGDVNGDGYTDIVTGAGPGGGPHVRLFSGKTGDELGGFFAFDPADRAGVHVALGDVTGDGNPDILAGQRSGGSVVKVFDGVTLAEVRSVPAFGPGGQAGVSVAAADLDGDGTADVLAGKLGGGAEVRAFSGRSGDRLLTVPLDSPDFAGGAWVAAADVTADGRADVIAGAGPGGGPTVRVFDGKTGQPLFGFVAYEGTFRGGVTVAAADVDGDGVPDVVTGTGVGGGPRARAFSGRDGTPLPVDLGNYFAYAADFRGGMYVAAADLTADGRADVVTGPGPGGGTHVRGFRATDVKELANFIAYDPVALSGGFSEPGSAGPQRPDFDLDPAFDSPPVGDGVTTFAAVTIRGTTGPGVTVRLGDRTATSGTDGAFSYMDVPLRVGDNVITIVAVDRLGRQRSASRTFRREEVTTPSIAQALLGWNDTLLAAVRADASAPPVATRAMAMLNAAMADVTNGFGGTPGYFVSAAPAAGADPSAAVAAAARRVLSDLFPAQSTTFDAELGRQLQSVPDGAGKTTGLAFGESVAGAVLALRADDGADRFLDYSAGAALGAWEPTPPAFAEEQLPQWAAVTPFVLDRPDQFRPAPPPAVGTAEWMAALDEVRSLGRADSPARTGEQADLARLWADGAGTATPPGHWLQIALDAARQRNADAATVAAMLAALTAALADTSVAAWDAKYFYGTWRPVTAIREADRLGNPAVQPDPDWTPLLITPNHPEYVSGHSSYSRAAATVLERFFPGHSFTTTGTALGRTVTRTYPSFDAAAADAGRSRIFGGIHFEFSNQAGQQLGRRVAERILAAFDRANDTAGPVVSLDVPSGTPQADPTVRGRVNDRQSGVRSLTARVGDAAPVAVPIDAAAGTFAFTPTVSADGTYAVTFTATDNAGNSRDVAYSLVLDRSAPTVTLTSPTTGGEADGALTLAGTVSDIGGVARLTYSLDEPGAARDVPVPVGPDGSFNVPVDLSRATPGPRTLRLTATDAAGNAGATEAAFTLTRRPALTVSGVLPLDGAADVGVTYRPRVTFSRPVTGVSAANIYALDPAGTRLAVNPVLSDDGSFAWVFFPDGLPGGSAVTLVVDGNGADADPADDIRGAADGEVLDAAGTGAAGGERRVRFTTVSRTATPGLTVTDFDTAGNLLAATTVQTTVTGVVADPGPDRLPGTPDDVRAGADGLLMTGDDVYQRPLAGVRVYALGREDQVAVADAGGAFTLVVPVGTVKLVIDGKSATNAPAGVFFPEMVMDLEAEPGLTNTPMGSMGTAEQKAAHEDVRGVYLPRVAASMLRPADPAATTVLRPDAASAPDLSPAERAGLSLTVPAGATRFDAAGRPVAGGRIGISTVPPELVRDMLPPGVLQHTFDITIQAEGVSTFGTPLPLTVPNTFRAAPGTRLNFLSFDHTTGRLEIEGTATVSADGKMVTTDPGQGVTHPGWHGVSPPGAAGAGQPGGPCEQLTFGERVAEGLGAIAGFVAVLFDKTGALVDAAEAYTGVNVLPPGAEAVFCGLDTLKNTVDMFRKEELDEKYAAQAGLVVKFFDKFGDKFPGIAEREIRTTKLLLAMESLKDTVKDINEQQDRLTAAFRGVTPCEPAKQDEISDLLERISRQSAEIVRKGETQILRFNRLKAILDQLSNTVTRYDPTQPNFGLPPGEPETAVTLADEYADIVAVTDQEGVFWNDVPGLMQDLGQLADGFTEPNRPGRPGAGEGGTGGAPLPAPGCPMYWAASGGGETFRGRSGPSETVRPFLPPNTVVRLELYDPANNRYGLKVLNTGVTGAVDFGLIPLLTDTATDTDGDGLSDRAEGVIGTSPNRRSTAGDGVSDGAKVAQCLDPLGNRVAQTGVVGRVTLAGPAQAVAVAGSAADPNALTAYVAVGDGGLAVVDVADPTRPIVRGQFALPGTSAAVAVDEAAGLAAVAAGTDGLHLIDVTDPAHPALLATVAGDFATVAAADGVAYAADGTILRAIDLATGEELAALALGNSRLTGLAYSGGTLYAMTADRFLRVVDASDFGLVAQGSVRLSHGAGRLTVNGTLVYAVADSFSQGGYVTVDVSNPDGPREVSGSDVPGTIAAPGTALALNGSGLGLLAGRTNGGADVVDLMDVRNPDVTNAFRTRFEMPGEPNDVAVAAGLGLVAAGDGGLVVLNYRSADAGDTPPTVTLSLPGITGGTASEGATVDVRVTADDDVQVRGAEVLVNGRVALTDLSPPFGSAINLPTLASVGSSTVTLQVRATDTGGNVGLSNVVTLALTPDTTPPTIARSSLADGAVVGPAVGRVRLTFSEPLDPQSVTADAFRVVEAGGRVVRPALVRPGLGGRVVVLEFPRLPLGDYRFEVPAGGVRDRAGNPLAAGLSTRLRVVPATESRFDAGADGWGVVGDADPPAFVPAGGNPGGHVTAADQGRGVVWYWSAPAPFLGDRSASFGLTLSFDLKTTETDRQPYRDVVRLRGGGLTLECELPPPGARWTAYRVALAPAAGWRLAGTNRAASEADFQAVLRTLVGLEIRGEYSAGGDVGGLDNVVLLG